MAEAGTGDLPLAMPRQPDEVTCGPTCLYALLRYYGERVTLPEVIAATPQLVGGGTLAVLLGVQALCRGYRCRLYTYNLQLFDPTWFIRGDDLAANLREQMRWKPREHQLVEATHGYLDFLTAGGEVLDNELTSGLITRHLRAGRPVLTGLSSTYLYRASRIFGPDGIDDDIRGRPEGHFVVIDGYDTRHGTFTISDPYRGRDGRGGEDRYAVPRARLLAAILLGITTYDANLLVIEPGRQP